MSRQLKRNLIILAVLLGVLGLCGLIVTMPGTTEWAKAPPGTKPYWTPSVWNSNLEPWVKDLGLMNWLKDNPELLGRVRPYFKPFHKPAWNNIGNWLRLMLATCTAGFLILEARARALKAPFTEAMKKGVAVAVVLVSFFAYYDFFNPNTRYIHYYHRHEYFHYYLGSKYSTELGYYGLYDCAAIAEMENGRRSQVMKRDIRDLHVNLIKKVKNYWIAKEPERCKKHFTEARWNAFRKEVNFFYKSAAGSYYEGMMKDHGYNPPPVWTMQGKLLGSLAPVEPGQDYNKDLNGDKRADYKDYPHHEFFKWMASIDVVLQASMFALLWWAFGWRVTMVAAILFGTSGPENYGFYWTGGAFDRMDWIFLLVAAMSFAKKRMFWLAGAALAWSGLLRIFPFIMFYGWACICVSYMVTRFRHWWPALTKGDMTAAARWLLPGQCWRLIGGAAVCIAILVPTSCYFTAQDQSSVSGFFKPYVTFVEHIQVHTGTPLTNQMGLETMIVHNWEGRMRFTRDNNLEDPFQKWKEGRTNRAEEFKWLKNGIIVALALWIFWALRRTKLLWLGIPLSVPMTVAMTNMTCYYFVCFICAAALVQVRPSFGPAACIASAASLTFVRFGTFFWIDDRYAALSWLFFVFGLVIVYAYSRPISLARLRAWAAGEQEPTGLPRRHRGAAADEAEGDGAEADDAETPEDTSASADDSNGDAADSDDAEPQPA